MATLEKPRKEKTKKTKSKQRANVYVSQEDEHPRLAIESPGTATSDENIVTQCPTSSKFTEQLREITEFETHESSTPTHQESDIAEQESDNSIAEVLEKCIAKSESISLENELAQAETVQEVPSTPNAPLQVKEHTQSPSAPPCLENTESTTVQLTFSNPSPTIQYPDLSPMQRIEKSANVVYQTRVLSPRQGLAGSELKPFTKEQLAQIYSCNELEKVKQFELEFLMNSLLESNESDPLHAALLEYYTLQSKLTVNMHDITSYRKMAIKSQETIWENVDIERTFTGKCGDGIELKHTVTYKIAQVNGKNLESCGTALKTLHDLLCKTYLVNHIAAHIAKAKVEYMINELITCTSVERALQQSNYPSVSLNSCLDQETLQCATRLRHAIAILFAFTRQMSPNSNFDTDLKNWLCKLVSLHLRISTKEDHWFLIFNILRCPSGVGTWAAAFIQVPMQQNTITQNGAQTNELPLDLDDPHIKHCITVIQTLLFPIKKRNDYLKQFTQSHKEISDPVKEDRWILIDSDGEDSHNSSGECVGLKENDLIALLNQVPFEKLFLSALGVEKFLGDYILNADAITPNKIIRVIAFFAKLIELFGHGMLTYNNERYKQLAKRLGRLIRHTLQYLRDYHELFTKNSVIKDTASTARIAVEMNSLLMKACTYIYQTRNLATWQYYSSLPYPNLDTQTIMQIFYHLNVGFPTERDQLDVDYLECLNPPDFWSKFNVAHADSSAEDLYYLLQAFFEMANGRSPAKDWDLIKLICLHIFNIGYINKPTREICYKTARDMLVNLTLAYERLMSELLLQLKIRFNDVDNVTYLFQSLPLENWKPDMDSFDTLSNWLLHYEYHSKQNMLARTIISHLNWSFDCDGRLFLPHNIHVRMACLITEALNKNVPELIGVSGITESVRQVSTLMDFSQSTKEQFTNWCWSMIALLRLHLMDQGTESVKKMLQNPVEPLLFLPELERIQLIYQSVTENRPLAIYVAILISLHGHSIPLICQKGLGLIKLLLNDYRHAAVIRCIELIMPLFLETPETLANCESFQQILNSLLTADKTYLKMAKDIICANSIGPVLELLNNMIHHQITQYADYGLSTPLNLINIWLNCLTSLPNWSSSNAVFLVDKILAMAYQYPNARLQVINFFQNYYHDCEDWKGVNKMSTLKSLFGSNQTRLPQIDAQHAWLAIVLLEIEFKMQEAHLWPEFLRQLAADSTKSNLETILKKTTATIKVTQFPAQMLVIYKYGNLIANMNPSHHLFPVANQKFFELLLSRVTNGFEEDSSQTVYGVSDKLYEYNMPLMKKIKANLKAAQKHYTQLANEQNDVPHQKFVYSNCANMMKTYMLWLEETSINRQMIDALNFPPQYNTDKLREILNGNTSHWTEFIFLPVLCQEQKQLADQWARRCYRLSSQNNRVRPPLQSQVEIAPMERIKSHLGSYDEQCPPPEYVKPKLFVYEKLDRRTLKDIHGKIKILSILANKINFTASELNSINRTFLDTIIKLYEMMPYEQNVPVSCNSLLFNRSCSRPAAICTRLELINENTLAKRYIESYRDQHEHIIDELITFDVDEFASTVIQLRQLIRLLTEKKSNHSEEFSTAIKVGINFFFDIIENMNETTMKFQPTYDFFTQMLDDLGVFVKMDQEQQGMTVLHTALKRPDLIKHLSIVFVPSFTRPEYFLKMYTFLIDSHLKKCDTKILFVLFSKFDIPAWFARFHPKLYDINKLLVLVFRGLECWSQPDSALLHTQFERHLVHCFEHDFPEHYGEVMQMMLERVSEQKLMPVVLMNVLNALLARFNCEPFTLEATNEKIHEISIDFARRQNLFNLKAATDTMLLFARHFQKERLTHGLHGLHPKHKEYCKPLAMWFSCFSHIVVVTAICTYQDLLADQISDIIFGSVIEMYSPWLITYTDELMQQQMASWIRQFTETGQKLYPWSEQHVNTCKIILAPFINTLKFTLEHLPASHKILSHTFHWYMHHFATEALGKHIYSPIHEALAQLPWEKFKPESKYIELLHNSLNKFIPESHAMLGYIFIRIDWNTWFAEDYPALPLSIQPLVISRLFTIFIKISFEPNIHTHVNMSKILEDAIKYPWHLVDFNELENLFKWLLGSVEPSIILQIPTETNYVDRAVFELLSLACGMMPRRNAAQYPVRATAKRILYVRSIVRLQRLCANKNQKLLATRNGLNAFNTAFHTLLNTISNCVESLRDTMSLADLNAETLNMIIEILTPMQTQSELVSNLHIEGMINWQQNAMPGNILMYSTLPAIGHMKVFIAGIYTLLEATITNYFFTSPETRDTHTPSWSDLLRTLIPAAMKLDIMPILGGPHLFTLHIYILYKLEIIKDSDNGAKISFLQDMWQIAEKLKSRPNSEPQLVILWGVLIARSVQILPESENAKKILLMLGRHMAELAAQTEGWGEGLLGAIGLKKDIVTSRRKALSRCLACVIFSLFPHGSEQQTPNQECTNSMNELTMLIANKKFADIKSSIVKAIGILKHQPVPMPRDVPQMVCRLIGLFYDNLFLTTLPEVWDFDFKLSRPAPVN